jgi:hypothetical protein
MEQARLAERERELLYKGLTVGPTKYLNPKDAKMRNIAVIDMSMTTFSDADKEFLLGDWEAEFQVGYIYQINAEEDADDPILSMRAYEPYHADAAGAPVMPLWAWKALAPADTPVSTAWKDVVKLPWQPIDKLPLSTWEHFYAKDYSAKLTEEKRAELLDLDFEGTKIALLKKLPNGPCVNKPSSNKFNASTRKNILSVRSHRSNVAVILMLDEEEREAYSMGSYVHTFDTDELERMAGLDAVQEKSRADCVTPLMGGPALRAEEVVEEAE